jgi:hypothetical protein
MVVRGFSRQNLHQHRFCLNLSLHKSASVGSEFHAAAMKIKHLKVENSPAIAYFISYEDYIGAAPFSQIISN